ncbi:type I secretion system protein [Staphylococcus kloosii]|uniref:Type I secretion system protein n=1 Tax=Staphylococcus kloosii TaxID=29384 RepID=A0ABQ0XJF9_9STAP|nr:type I secretion system protein [Staphylococcus kloosii]AVQ35066.1 type I secretion system protein [Staphylococcus kloosii]MBF7030274.1 type I secretion system protein [Staphylococcus kloosii]PNZ08163.1 type I secretion system protein [Staphylococcus kloosii]SUM48106.1 Uncharacterised protein [Staphylococcus kloosii]GEP81500.1 hypothetical protein SKL01_06780 [Staphylococcus kloosii]
MSEFISALAGGLIALIGVWLQFRKEDRDKRIDYENDIKSMIDLIVYKVARIRNTELDEKRVLKSRDYTSEIFFEIESDFKNLNDQLQTLIMKLSHHDDNSSYLLQDLLRRFAPLEIQFKNFKVTYKIYDNNFEEKKKELTSIIGSKVKLDKEVREFILKMNNFARKNYNHKILEPDIRSYEEIKSKNKYTFNE